MSRSNLGITQRVMAIAQQSSSSAWLYAIASVVIVSLLSLIGLAAFTADQRRIKSIIFLMVSLATGSLFADAVLELLPESYQRSGAQAGLSVLAGIYLFFLLERLLHWRHEHSLQGTAFGYLNLAADAIHNFTDGAIIGASYLASIPIGVSTTVAVIAHEIPHELGNFFVLLYAGFSRTRALFYNFLSALFAIAGTMLALTVGSRVGRFSDFMLPFAAGGFLYIAGSDLLPELQKEATLQKSMLQLAAMSFGAGIIWVLTQITS
jgi:zinc and cadmium transporter